MDMLKRCSLCFYKRAIRVTNVMMPGLTRIAVCLCFVFSGLANAQSESLVRIGANPVVSIASEVDLPFSDVSSVPNTYQSSPLYTLINVEFRQQETLGDAVTLLLDFLGYEFRVHGNAVDPMAMEFYQKPLSDVHRTFQDVTVLDALLSLVGEGYTLVFDHSLRAASVDVKPSVRLLKRVGELR